MAVKTITIDMEAYEELSKRKKPGESFSHVIKRTFREERYSARNLLENLNRISFSIDTLNSIEEQVKRRKDDYPEVTCLE